MNKSITMILAVFSALSFNACFNGKSVGDESGKTVGIADTSAFIEAVEARMEALALNEGLAVKGYSPDGVTSFVYIYDSEGNLVKASYSACEEEETDDDAGLFSTSLYAQFSDSGELQSAELVESSWIDYHNFKAYYHSGDFLKGELYAEEIGEILEIKSKSDEMSTSDLETIDSILKSLKDNEKNAESIGDEKIVFLWSFYEAFFNGGMNWEDGARHYLKHCSKPVIQSLKDNYEYDCEDGDCYAWYIFRDAAQDIAERGYRFDFSEIGDGWYNVRITNFETIDVRVRLEGSGDRITITGLINPEWNIDVE